MVYAELSHNPYLLKTVVTFNGQEPRSNSQIEKYLSKRITCRSNYRKRKKRQYEAKSRKVGDRVPCKLNVSAEAIVIFRISVIMSIINDRRGGEIDGH